MLQRLRSFLPSQQSVATIIEVSGLSAIGAGAWMQWGQSVGLIVSGVLAALFGTALTMPPREPKR